MIETRRHVTHLENGITVLSERAPHFNRAALAVSVLAGGVDDPEGKEGLAHVLEHLIFRGTPRLSSEDLQSAIVDLGGFVNGQTLIDHTVFTATVIRDDVEKTLGLFSELLSEPRLDENDIELEKKIVEDENCRGCFGCSMSEAFFGAAYPEQILSRPVIGYEDTVKGLTREDLEGFHKTYYVGANLTISVCGDIPHEEAVEMVRRHFSAMPKGEAKVWKDFTYEGGDMLMGSRGEDAAVWLGFDVTDLSDDEKRAIWLFMDIVGGHPQSLLMQELREKRGLVYSVHSDMDTHARRDVIQLHLRGPSASMREICELTIDTLTRAAKTLDPKELERARRRHHLGAHMSQDALEGRVEDMVTDISDLGRVTDPAERYRRYQAMTAAELTGAAQKILGASPTIVVMAPLRTAPKFSDLRARLKRGATGGRLLGFLKRTG